MYQTLVDDVIPTFYNDRQRWLNMMKASIESCTEAFSADRMLREYDDRLYKAQPEIIS